MLPFKYKCTACGHIQEEERGPYQFIPICNKCGRVDMPLYSIDLFYIKPESIVKLLEDDLRRRKEKRRPTLKLLWTNNKGEQVEISKCNYKHVENIIRMVSKFISV